MNDTEKGTAMAAVFFFGKCPLSFKIKKLLIVQNLHYMPFPLSEYGGIACFAESN
ncbi:hypothetical protein ACFQ9Y_12950 [Peribacillus simplex]|uniref:hypothetical protein n=1 Tax=Peribacillus simplex TaxID=1478 RepID=UPI0036714A2B